MENAGRSVAENVAPLTKRRNVCIVAYKGNNGGDGFVAARHLKNLGFDVSVYLLCKRKEVSGSARINLDILTRLKVPISFSKLEKLLASSDVVVDAIFGIGFSGKVEGEIAKAIDLINQYRRKRKCCVVAVDVPSGVNATSGKADKHSITADLTVTFAYPKKGFLKYPAIKNIGKLVVADIGMPLWKPRRLRRAVRQAHRTERSRGAQSSRSVAGFQSSNVEFFLPKRLAWTHKGNYGRVLVIAGSRNMSGAAYLTSRAALRAGAGLVYLAVPKSIQKLVAAKTREVITIGLPETGAGTLSLKAYGLIRKIKADVVAIGPGLTTHPETKELVKKLVRQLKVSCVVLDADGLNCIADDPSILKKSKSRIIITPHPGEMSRLIGKNVGQIQRNRVKIAQNAARKWKVEVVLKGAYTIVVEKEKVYINSSGNPGMASAGVGDVLTGMLAAFLAQGLTVKEAVYVHGLAGDLAAREKGEYGLIASDLSEKIPYAIQKIN